MQALLSKLEVIMPRDKWMHLAVGLIVGAMLVILAAAQRALWPAFFQQHPIFFLMLDGGACVHAAKEATDRLDNLLMYHQGRTAIHGVEWGDFFAGLAGTAALASALLWTGVV